MGEYEPDDSRIVTNVASEAPGEPPRTGPREAEARAKAREAHEDEGTTNPPRAMRGAKSRKALPLRCAGRTDAAGRVTCSAAPSTRDSGAKRRAGAG